MSDTFVTKCFEMNFQNLYSKSFQFYRVFNSLRLLRCHRQWVSRTTPLRVTNKCKLNPKTWNKSSAGNGTVDRNALLSWDFFSGLIGLGVWLGIIEDYELEDPLILTIKRGIYCMQNEEYEKAETILHSALQMAQDLSFEEAQAYVYDILANNYFKKEDYKRAEQLFAAVFNYVLRKGMSPNDETLIEISVKLSHIYSELGEWDKCQTGFDFCLTEQNKRVESFKDKKTDELIEDEVNSLALLGMCHDFYAKHLSSVGKFDKALDNYKIALDICLKVNGETHPQTLVLLNDMSATYVHKKDYENALSYQKKALDAAILTEDKNLANYYYNIGSIYLLQLNKELALNSCRRSLSLTRESKDKTLEKKARECIALSN